MASASQQFPNLTGQTLVDGIKILTNYGFQLTKTTRGGYQTFEHPDGSIIHIRPNGEVVRTGPKIKAPDGSSYRRRYNQYGEQIKFVPGGNTHDTGENLIL